MTQPSQDTYQSFGKFLADDAVAQYFLFTKNSAFNDLPGERDKLLGLYDERKSGQSVLNTTSKITAKLDAAPKANAVSFAKNWDEWVALNMRPSKERDGGEATKEKIANRFKALVSTKNLVDHLQARHRISEEQAVSLSQANFTFEVMIGTQQFNADKTAVTGAYLTVLIKADIEKENEKESLGFLSYFLFDSNWDFDEKPIDQPVYENFLVSQFQEPRAGLENKLRQFSNSNDDVETIQQALDNLPSFELSQESQQFLAGEKIMSVPYVDLKNQFDEFQSASLEQKTGVSSARLAVATANFLHTRATTGGIKSTPSCIEKTNGSSARSAVTTENFLHTRAATGGIKPAQTLTAQKLTVWEAICQWIMDKLGVCQKNDAARGVGQQKMGYGSMFSKPPASKTLNDADTPLNQFSGFGPRF